MLWAIPVLIAVMLQPDPSFAGGGASGDLNEPVRGVIRARQTSSISSDLGAAVAHIGFRAGHAFKKGEVLLAFDCRRQEAEHAAAAAGLKEMKIAHDNSVYLFEKSAAGRLDVETARARMEKAAAELAVYAVRVSQCTLKAPFDGKVAELAIEEFETPQAGRPIITIVDTAEPEVELIVPSRWLAWLDVGRAFTFRIDETESTVTATIARIGAAADPVSQSVTVIGKFKDGDARIVPGMSGAAVFAPQGQ